MTQTPVEALPSGYSWGFVVGRAIRAVGDSAQDPDRFPEALGSNGTVSFTPLTTYRKHTTSPTAFVQHETITANIVHGTVVDNQGAEGIYLISGNYRVQFSLDRGQIPPFSIAVDETHTLENPLDLVLASPLAPTENQILQVMAFPPNPRVGWTVTYDGETLAWTPPETEDGAIMGVNLLDAGETAPANPVPGVLYLRRSGTALPAGIPSITSHPSNYSGLIGGTATFTASATGDPAPTCQWFISTDGGTTYSPIAGATTGTLNVAIVDVSQDGDRYRAVFTNSSGTAQTSSARLTAQTESSGSAPTITQQAQSRTVETGETATFTASASGVPTPTCQWQSNNGSGWVNITGATGFSYTTPQTTESMSGNQYRPIFTNSQGSATGNAVTLTVAVTSGPVDADWVDNFERADGPAGNGWTSTSGTATIVGGQLYNDGGSGYQRLYTTGHPSRVRWEVDISTPTAQYTGIYIGRGGAYPGVKVFQASTGGSAEMSLDTAEGPSVGITVPGLRAAIQSGATLGLSWNGSVIGVWADGQEIFTTTDASLIGYINPADTCEVGMCGTSGTSKMFAEARRYNL